MVGVEAEVAVMTEALGQAVASREATRGGNWGSGGLAPEEVTRLMESMVGDGGELGGGNAEREESGRKTGTGFTIT